MQHNFVLQIDDDPFVTENQKMIARKKDLSNYFMAVQDAVKALKLLENMKLNGQIFPRYIILDLRMPGMHGIEFLEEFDNRFPNKKYETEVIIASSRVSPEEMEKIQNYLFVTDFIVKPIPEYFLEHLINGVIG